ncbi:restriction endonuclease, partial [Streptomyces roseolus]|uniref:restriction endonuclease n=1 Tax=Streptomyces roseolus TaxID=67358 RepID=UPI0036475AF5
MSAVFLYPAELRDGGPAGLTKALERTLWHLGFHDVRVVDGANDHGADLLAVRNREQWVFQSKWKAHGTADHAGVDDLERARTHYRADKAVLATNTNITATAEARRRELAGVGVDIALWHGATLQTIGERMPERVPSPYELRPYQAEAVQAIERDLAADGSALLVLATGLGKTVVGGEVIGNLLASRPQAKILV